jgi:hypothetical protein
MQHLELYGIRLEFDDSKPYWTVGVEGAGPNGESIGQMNVLDPVGRIRLPEEGYGLWGVVYCVSEEMGYMEQLVNEGVIKSPNPSGPLHFREEDREKYARTWELYRTFLTGLADGLHTGEVTDPKGKCKENFVRNVLASHKSIKLNEPAP